MSSLEEVVKTIEDSPSIRQAAAKLGVTPQAVQQRLKWHKLRVVTVKSQKLEVVPVEEELKALNKEE